MLWEAQFGDFANGAQVIIDQFIVSGLAKWGQTSRLTLLLPHGYEGSGPEHSSARLERFLQLAAEGNIRVANPTTPAQYFHLLRRQARVAKQRPLVVMTPKSLLRLPQATSRVAELSDGRFQPVLAEPDHDPARVTAPDPVQRQDLLRARRPRMRQDNPYVAIGRVELLYPFPQAEILELVESYPNLEEVVWVQEEPRNMGARAHMSPRLHADPARAPAVRLHRAPGAGGVGRGLSGRARERAAPHRHDRAERRRGRCRSIRTSFRASAVARKRSSRSSRRVARPPRVSGTLRGHRLSKRRIAKGQLEAPHRAGARRARHGDRPRHRQYARVRGRQGHRRVRAVGRRRRRGHRRGPRGRRRGRADDRPHAGDDLGDAAAAPRRDRGLRGHRGDAALLHPQGDRPPHGPPAADRVRALGRHRGREARGRGGLARRGRAPRAPDRGTDRGGDRRRAGDRRADRADGRRRRRRDERDGGDLARGDRRLALGPRRRLRDGRGDHAVPPRGPPARDRLADRRADQDRDRLGRPPCTPRRRSRSAAGTW